MDEKIVFSKGSFFHGTKADLAIGDLIVTVSWQGHAPEMRNNMLENLRQLSEKGIKAID
ncbi:MAG: hypothetical protein K2P73_21310 [Lachnospiraceae bacterium]|nr:hypothetical protein [Lachnospiraceae bacterium]